MKLANIGCVDECPVDWAPEFPAAGEQPDVAAGEDRPDGGVGGERGGDVGCISKYNFVWH